MSENRSAPPNAPAMDSPSGEPVASMAAIKNLNPQRIGKFALCLFLVQCILGFIQGLLLEPSDDAQVAMSRFAVDVVISLWVSAAIFITLSIRHTQNLWLQASLVFLLHTAISLVFGWLIGMWLDRTYPAVLMFIEWFGWLLGAVLGTAIGAFPGHQRVRRSIAA